MLDSPIDPNYDLSSIFELNLSNVGCSLCLLLFKHNYYKTVDLNSNLNSNVSSNVNAFLVVADQDGTLWFLNISQEGSVQIASKIELECKSEVWVMKSVFTDEKTYTIYIGSAAGFIYAYSVSLLESKEKLDETQPNMLQIKELWKQKCGDMITKLDYFDITGDGNNEIIASSIDKTLRALEPKTGILIWGQIFQSGITTFQKGDPDNDGKLEIIAGAVDGSIRIFDGKDGKLKFFNQLPNNIRTIQVIKTPDSIARKTEPNTPNSSKNVIFCGCDDQNIYFLDGTNGKILESKNIGQNTYPWLSEKIPQKNKENLLLTTYTFEYMQGLVVSDKKSNSGIYFYGGNDLEIKWKIEKINVQCMSPILSFNNTAMTVLGTTDNRLIVLDVNLGKILLEKSCKNIINAVLVETINQNFYIYACDDSKNVLGFRVSPKK